MGLPDGTVYIFLGRCEKDLRAEALEDKTPFVAYAGGHAQFDMVTLGGPYHRDGDAGVARSRLEDGLLLCKLAPLFGPGDHVKGRAVLDGAAGITAFELAQYLYVGVGIDVAKFHEWRVAYGRKDVHESVTSH